MKSSVPPSSETLAPQGLALRPVTDADAPLLARWHAQFRGEAFLQMGMGEAQVAVLMADQLRLQQIHFAAAHPRADHWLALRADEPVGRMIVDRSRPDWRLVDLLLAREARGAGLGSRLMTWLQTAAVEAGAASITLDVGFDNAPALALYRKAGFVEEPSATEIAVAMRWRPG
ncbi:hypothetical protein CFHF_15620 [Caulobacter flavus]|uniref:N-acetyltransferase domain-containing protein n=1 Tax=Caulobacter flavus TaxID=1679497 RepID=A0A2N5CRK5_9CAUL|nr:GNAT family N-acetyltransferase [Caulobacter flavus]AYV46328.1 hypothetical protein C1707_08700 [Caulobacter flavus]PLR11997.1 hypothetical protein CFHF_15620 [Caulobacter flavus]